MESSFQIQFIVAVKCTSSTTSAGWSMNIAQNYITLHCLKIRVFCKIDTNKALHFHPSCDTLLYARGENQTISFWQTVSFNTFHEALWDTLRALSTTHDKVEQRNP